MGWNGYDDFASPPRSAFADENFGGHEITGAPTPMRMDFDGDSGSDIEVR